MYSGWQQLAFKRELTGDITPMTVGRRPLVAVNSPEGVKVYDAVCPHRGANLGYGGRLEGGVIVCPWHGRRIALGGEAGLCVRGYRTLELGELIFVLFSEQHENGLTAMMEGLAQTHYFIPGFTIEAGISPEYVIENAFDRDHFKYVHGIDNEPDLQLYPSLHGEMSVEGIFHTSVPNPWQEAQQTGAEVRTRFYARVFSPTLCVTELGEEGNPYIVITGATPTPDGNCVIRVSLAIAPAPDGTPPSKEIILALLRDSKTSFDQDLVIWENLSRDARNRLGPDDALVAKYHKFCRRFAEAE
jgi:3-ketosteroid 9alpha-monooxygenase subunit A